MRHPRGETNPVSVLLFLAAIAGLWWLWVYGAAHYDHFSVKEDVWEAFSTAAGGEEGARDRLLRRLNAEVGWHYQLDEETGVEVVAPGLGLSEEDIEVTVNPEVNLIRVHVEYDRVLPLKPSSRRTTVHFVAEKTGKMK